jgi:hypothetical protein
MIKLVNILESITENQVTKGDWDKADGEQRVDWLLQIFDDADEAEKHFETEWEDLPNEARDFMRLPESVNEEINTDIVNRNINLLDKAADMAIKNPKGNVVELAKIIKKYISGIRNSIKESVNENVPDDGDVYGWYWPIADKAMERLKKDSKYSGASLGAVGSGDGSTYISITVDFPSGSEEHFDVFFDGEEGNEQVTNIESTFVSEGKKSVNEGLSKLLEKIKGIDGKACWKGYRYAGTKDGKDKCVKVNEEEVDMSINEVMDMEIIDENITEAKFKGKTVTLNKPTRGDSKKFKVYVNSGKKNADGSIKVKKVNFGHGGTSAKKAGQKTMSIRKSNPKARSAFRARHNCDSPGPKTMARYWSCKKW